jgi:pyruvate/2-oxoglutarate dehydrogenase complex dihydrolipoamide acyltransferase (E2) component
MIHEVILPRLALGMTEGEIAKWHKIVGDRIEKGDELFDVVTEKVVVAVESPISGRLMRTLISEGETVPVGTVIAEIEVSE